jgi:cytochrome c551/c552
MLFATRPALTRAALTLIGLAATGATLAGPQDDKMLRLANFSGCLICHHVETGTKGPKRH